MTALSDFVTLVGTLSGADTTTIAALDAAVDTALAAQGVVASLTHWDQAITEYAALDVTDTASLDVLKKLMTTVVTAQGAVSPLTSLNATVSILAEMDVLDTASLDALTTLIGVYEGLQDTADSTGITALNVYVNAASTLSPDEAITNASLTTLQTNLAAMQAVETTQAKAPNLTFINNEIKRVANLVAAETTAATRTVNPKGT